MPDHDGPAFSSVTYFTDERGLARIPTSIVGRHTLALSDHAICAYVQQEKMLWCTPQYASIFGRKAHEIQGEEFKSIVGMHRWLQCEPYIKRVLQGESVNFNVVDAYRKNKVNNTYVPHFVSGGKVHGYYIASRILSYSENEEQYYLTRYQSEA